MSSTDETTSAAVNENAKFFDVEPDSDAILVIVGHMLMRWTNYRYKHTVHRVVEPPVDSIKAHKNEDSGMVPARFSIAFFSFPNTETTVEPFRNCYSDNGKNKRWKPINAGEYLAKKRGTVYSGLPSRVS
jgi:isopenicillin N synthase-like dioxygenase